MKKNVLRILCLLLFSLHLCLSFSASEKKGEIALSAATNPSIKALKQTKTAGKRAFISPPKPSKSLHKAKAVSRKIWHWATFVSFLMVLGFLGALASLFLLPSFTLWGIILSASLPFIAFGFSWLGYKKADFFPEKFSGKYFNWFVIAVVSVILYTFMVLFSIVMPIILLIALICNPYSYSTSGNWDGFFELLGAMWENPPKIPPFSKKE